MQVHRVMLQPIKSLRESNPDWGKLHEEIVRVHIDAKSRVTVHRFAGVKGDWGHTSLIENREV